VAFNDDSCGIGATLTYILPTGGAVCTSFEIFQGCSGTESCSGTTYINLTPGVLTFYGILNFKLIFCFDSTHYMRFLLSRQHR
jgi:hypothetical protein